MDDYDDIIEKIKKLVKQNKKLGKITSSFMRYNINFKKEVETRTSFLDSIMSNIRFVDRVWCLLNNIKSILDIPVCQYCKINKVRFEVDYRKDYGFSKTCSSKCGNKLGLQNSKTSESIKKAEKTKKKVLIEKYGVDHVSKIPGINKKKNKTAIENYGSLKDAYYNTALKTIKKKYNVDNISKLDDIKEKKKETSRKNYGFDFPWQSDNGKQKQKEGVLIKYNVENISKLEEIKIKKEKTLLKNYGVTNYSYTIEFIELMSGKNNPNWLGGISNNGYCEIFSLSEFKNIIKERDKFNCLNPCCNKKCIDDLVIHHIDYNKKNCNLNNLITICRSCNTIANFNRQWHKSWYNTIIFNRYGKRGL